jgi:hypothetical protein
VKKIFVLFVLLFLFFARYSVVSARSGCCSHHGGVCGCGCCDGTSLSATCAPYYPSCSSNTSPIYILPTVVPTRKPTRIPTLVPTKVPTKSPTKSPATSINKTSNSTSFDSYSDLELPENDQDGSSLSFLLGAGTIGTIIYLANKGKK